MKRLILMTGLILMSSAHAQNVGDPARPASAANTGIEQQEALKILAPYLSAGKIPHWAEVLRTNVTRSQYAQYLSAATTYYTQISPDPVMASMYRNLPPTSLLPNEEISGTQAQAYVAQALINLEVAGIPAGFRADGTPILVSPQSAARNAAVITARAPVMSPLITTSSPPVTTPPQTDAVQVWQQPSPTTTQTGTPGLPSAAQTIPGNPSTARLVVIRPLIDAGMISASNVGGRTVITRNDGQGGQALVNAGHIGVKWRAGERAAWTPNNATAGSPLPAMTRNEKGRLAVPDEALEAIGCAVVMAGEAVNVACGLQTATSQRPLNAPLSPEQSSDVASPTRR